jgi:hypothetical protein
MASEEMDILISLGNLHNVYDLTPLKHSERDPEAANSRYLASKNQQTDNPALQWISITPAELLGCHDGMGYSVDGVGSSWKQQEQIAKDGLR